ncbi:MAG: hypothetical protein AAF235_08675 [Planctomycetota bacterium]
MVARQDFEREGIVWNDNLCAFGLRPTLHLPTDEYREQDFYIDPPECSGSHSFPWSGGELMLAAVGIEDGARDRQQVTLTLYDVMGSRWRYTYDTFTRDNPAWVMPRRVDYQPDRGPALLFAVIYIIPVMFLALAPALLVGGLIRLVMKYRRKGLKRVSMPAEEE